MPASIALDRTPLQELHVDALAYGAKDTGEMGGGAAAAVLAAAGPELLPALQRVLVASSRQVGDAVITDAFGLHARSVRWIVHVISIIKCTPQGAWCPTPAKLRDGVLKGLRLAHENGARSIAFSMLGTGEGRVPPVDAARLMFAAFREFSRVVKGDPLQIVLSLPTHRDYVAAEAVLAAGP